jgi:hypothetical protein
VHAAADRLRDAGHGARISGNGRHLTLRATAEADFLSIAGITEDGSEAELVADLRPASGEREVHCYEDSLLSH